MKKLTSLLLVIVLLGIMACSKTSPEPSTIYTLKYSIVSSPKDSVLMDTIQYKNYSGEIITLLGVNELDYSCTSADSYQAYLYMSGDLLGGEVSLSVEVSSENAVVFQDSYGNSGTGTVPMHFRYKSQKDFLIAK